MVKTFFILIFPFFFHGYFLHTGDSLLRQLHTTLILHLTNNWKNGSMPVGTSKQNVQKCRYMYQIFMDVSSKLRTIFILRNAGVEGGGFLLFIVNSQIFS